MSFCSTVACRFIRAEARARPESGSRTTPRSCSARPNRRMSIGWSRALVFVGNHTPGVLSDSAVGGATGTESTAPLELLPVATLAAVLLVMAPAPASSLVVLVGSVVRSLADKATTKEANPRVRGAVAASASSAQVSSMDMNTSARRCGMVLRSSSVFTPRLRSKAASRAGDISVSNNACPVRGRTAVRRMLPWVSAGDQRSLRAR